MEATVVCIDNSEWTRNGDYAPTRFQAQADAVNLLAGAKTEANPENTVGVLTMAGKSPRVLVTPTPDLGKILNSMQVGEVLWSSPSQSLFSVFLVRVALLTCGGGRLGVYHALKGDEPCLCAAEPGY